MLDVINTVDGAFFRKVMKEYEAVTLKQAAKRDKVVKLDPKMYSVLNKFNEVFMSRTAKNQTAKFNLPPKKRKRHEREQWPALQARIVPEKYEVVQQQKRLKLD